MAMVRAAEQGIRRAATARPRRGRTRHRSATCAKREAASGDARREASEIESAPGRNPSGAFACEGRRRDAIAAAIIAPLMSLPLPSLADAGDATDGPSSTEVAVDAPIGSVACLCALRGACIYHREDLRQRLTDRSR